MNKNIRCIAAIIMAGGGILLGVSALSQGSGVLVPDSVASTLKGGCAGVQTVTCAGGDCPASDIFDVCNDIMNSKPDGNKAYCGGSSANTSCDTCYQSAVNCGS